MERYTLNNGLKIIFHKMPNTHSVTLGLYIKAGQAYGDESYIGITHLLEHLHFRRIGDMTQDKLYYEMESMGSTLRAATYRDFLKFTMKIVPNKLDRCIKIFQNLIEAYEWTDDEFLQEKQVVRNQIIEKGDYISFEKEVKKVIFKDHPLSYDIVGNAEDIQLIDKVNVLEYKKQIFNSENMLFCATGNLTDSDCQKITEELQLCLLMRTTEKKNLECPKCFQCRKPDIGLVHVQDDNPLEVNISFDINYSKESKDLLTILNCILGEGVGSRLQRHIREEKCYTSNIASYIEWYQNFAVLHINFSVEKKWLLCCVEEIINIIEELKGNITRKDLDVSLPFYTTNHIFYEDDTEEMNFLLAYNGHVLNMDYQVPELENVDDTILKLQKLAKEMFVKKNVSVLVLGNTNGITKRAIMKIIEKL